MKRLLELDQPVGEEMDVDDLVDVGYRSAR